MMGINAELLQCFINFLIKYLAKELHKPIIRKFKKKKVHSLFITNIWGIDLGDMQFINTFSQVFIFL